MTDLLNNRQNSSSKIDFVKVTDIYKLVDFVDPWGRKTGKSVYGTTTYKYVDSQQNSILTMEYKGGNIIRVKTCKKDRPEQEIDFPSMCGVMRKLSEFAIIECGKSSMRKDLIAVDIDGSYSKNSIFDKLKTINNLPECVVTQNTYTNHWQILFFLKNNVQIKELNFNNFTETGKCYPTIEYKHNIQAEYMTYVKRFSIYFKKIFPETDYNYKGTFCRNPYFKGQLSYLFKNGIINSLKNERPIGNDIYDLKNFLDQNNIVLRKNINLNPEKITENVESCFRHDLEGKFSNDYIWSCLRQGFTPTENDLFNYLMESRFLIAEYAGKDKPHTEKEIRSQVKSRYKWAMDHYKHLETNGKQMKRSVEWNKIQRERKFKKAKKLKETFLAMMDAGFTLQEIAESLCISRQTLYTYLPLFYVIDMIKTRNYFKDSDMKYGPNKHWDDIIYEITNKIKELKLRFGNSKIKWKDLNYDLHVDDYKYSVNYDVLFISKDDFMVA